MQKDGLQYGQTYNIMDDLTNTQINRTEIWGQTYTQTYFVLNTSLIITVNFISYRQPLRHTKSEGQTNLQRMKDLNDL